MRRRDATTPIDQLQTLAVKEVEVSSPINSEIQIPKIVHLSLQLSSRVGRLCEVLQWLGDGSTGQVGLTGCSEAVRKRVCDRASGVLVVLLTMAEISGIDLAQTTLLKIAKNDRKYPVDAVRGRHEKYDTYKQSHHDTSLDHSVNECMVPTGTQTLETLRGLLRNFAQEREWEQFHMPRSLLLALSGEVGEVADEVARNSGHVSGDEGSVEGHGVRSALGEELADCLCYLIRFADVANIDLNVSPITST